MNEKIINAAIYILLGFAAGVCAAVFIWPAGGSVDAVRARAANSAAEQQRLAEDYNRAAGQVKLATDGVIGAANGITGATDSLGKLSNDSEQAVERSLDIIGKIRQINGEIQKEYNATRDNCSCACGPVPG